MKRSDMILLLQEAINRLIYQDSFVDFFDASDILKQLEKAGMVPPILKELSFQLLPNGEMTYAVHEWEPEKEELKQPMEDYSYLTDDNQE